MTSANVTRPLWPIRQVAAGLLDVGYAELGPADGPPVVLLHGWPYDIHSFADVAPMLAAGAAGHRPLSARLRHHPLPVRRHRPERPAGRAGGRHRSRCWMPWTSTRRCVGRLRLGGPDGRHRRGALAGALQGLVSVSGYLIGSQAAGARPLPPAAEQQWWYQYYFATERGRAGYEANRRDFARLIWHTASPQWAFDDATFERTRAALDNPDHVAIVIHNYRWRLGLAEGDPQYDDLERQLAAAPAISVPTVTLEGDANGAPHPEPVRTPASSSGPTRTGRSRRHRTQPAPGGAGRLRAGRPGRRRLLRRLPRGGGRLGGPCRDGADLVGEARPQDARQVVPHPGEADELGVRDGLRQSDTSADVDQRVVHPVHHQRGDLDLTQERGPVRLGDDGPQLPRAPDAPGSAAAGPG